MASVEFPGLSLESESMGVPHSPSFIISLGPWMKPLWSLFR